MPKRKTRGKGSGHCPETVHSCSSLIQQERQTGFQTQLETVIFVCGGGGCEGGDGGRQGASLQRQVKNKPTKKIQHHLLQSITDQSHIETLPHSQQDSYYKTETESSIGEDAKTLEHMVHCQPYKKM